MLGPVWISGYGGAGRVLKDMVRQEVESDVFDSVCVAAHGMAGG